MKNRGATAYWCSATEQPAGGRDRGHHVERTLANRGKAEATGEGRRLLITLAGSTPKAEMHGADEEDAE